jgi:two-component system chemotaxis response regulator CheY
MHAAQKTVMLIDDSPTTRQVMRFALERAGYAVVEAGDGAAALTALSGQRLSAIVCDIAMPNMDGLTFLKSLRAKSEYRFTPVVMLTTESRTDRKQQAKSSGAQAWATKPCPPSQLVDIINRLAV